MTSANDFMGLGVPAQLARLFANGGYTIGDLLGSGVSPLLASQIMSGTASATLSSLGLPPLVSTLLSSASITPPVSNLLNWFINDVATFATYGNATSPSAFYDLTGNKTWLSRQRWNGSVRKEAVIVYDHANGTYGNSYDAFQDLLTDDDHGVPSMAMDPFGYVHAFGGAHVNPIQYACTVNPRDPSAWTAQVGLGNNMSYPHPVFVGSVCYLFTRDTNQSGQTMPMALAKGTANGGAISFGAFTDLIDLGSNTRWYAGTYIARGTTIWTVATRADYGDTIRQDIYLLGYDTLTGNLVNWDGSATYTPSQYPLTRTQVEASFRVVNQNATGHYGNIPSLAFDTNGNACIAYEDGAVSQVPNYNYNCNVLTLAPGSLTGTTVTVGVATQRYNGITIIPLPNNQMDLYWSADITNAYVRGGDILTARRSSAGAWSAYSIVQASSTLWSLDPPSYVKDAHPNLRITFSENAQPPSNGSSGGSVNATTGLGCGRVYAYGDSGFVTRPLSILSQTTAYIAAYEPGAGSTEQAALNELFQCLLNTGVYTTLGLAGVNAAIASYPNATTALSNIGDPNKTVTLNAIARYLLNGNPSIRISGGQAISTNGGVFSFSFSGPAPTDIDYSIDGSVFVNSSATSIPAPAASSLTMNATTVTTNGGLATFSFTGVPPTDIDYSIDGGGFVTPNQATLTLNAPSGVTTASTSTGSFTFTGTPPTNVDYSIDGAAFVTA